MMIDRVKYLEYLNQVLSGKIVLEDVPSEYQTSHLCFEVVKNNVSELKHVKKQTVRMCLAAVKIDPLVLIDVKEQTEEICLAAVKEFGLALRHVKDKTPEVCLEAIKNEIFAIKFIKNIEEIAHLVPDNLIESGMSIIGCSAEWTQVYELKKRLLLNDSVSSDLSQNDSLRKIKAKL